MRLVAQHVLTAWPRILGAARALEQAGSFAGIYRGVEGQRALVERAALAGETLESAHIEAAVRCCAAFEDVHPDDWLRFAAIEDTVRRRRPPPPVAIALRLYGAQAEYFSARVTTELDGTESVRVTIRTTRGDVASCRREDFDEALEGALKMVGAGPKRPSPVGRDPLPDAHNPDGGDGE